MTMEKGKLSIIKTKKGDFAGQIVFEKDGKSKMLGIPPTSYKLNETLNGQNCTFVRENGLIIRVVTEAGDVIYEKRVTAISSQLDAHDKTKAMQSKSPKLSDSFDLKETLLPSDVRSLPITDIDNFALKLNKAARYDKESEKFKFFHKSTNKNDLSYQICPNFRDIPLQEILERQSIHTKAVCRNNCKVLTFSPDWRLIIGIGSESVYETSMTLHHVYGIPYIPASAIKGVARSFYITEKFGFTEDSERQALGQPEFCDIFGCDKTGHYKEAREGKIIFFDAFPEKLDNKSIKIDIMNVHYPEYYSEGKSPTDTQNPIPIPFLTIENTPFRFIVGIKKPQNNLLDKVVECLKNALEQHGIGAKTAGGYGYGQATEK
jgi:CRISPR-associated protein Cmr6